MRVSNKGKDRRLARLRRQIIVDLEKLRQNAVDEMVVSERIFGRNAKPTLNCFSRQCEIRGLIIKYE